MLELDDLTHVSVVGEVDHATRERVAARLLEAVDRGRPVRVDLSPTTFMDSWGLAAVLEAHASASGAGVDFEVVAASRQVGNLLVITGVAVDFGWPTFREDPIPVVDRTPLGTMTEHRPGDRTRSGARGYGSGG